MGGGGIDATIVPAHNRAKAAALRRNLLHLAWRIVQATTWRGMRFAVTMETKIISQHKQRIKFTTLLSVFMVGIVFLTIVAGVGTVFYMYVNGRPITWFEGLATIAVGLFLGGLNGICFARFIRRMLPVRKVVLFEDDRIEIVTWRDKTFTAKLPDNIKHIAVIGNDFSVTVQIENRCFIVDGEQFSDKDGINQYFRHFVERCQAKSD